MTTRTFTVRVSDSAGNETVGTQTFQVDSGIIPITGDFAGTIESSKHGHITGDVNLTGDLIVEGLLTGIDTFTLTGNGFQILIQNGGVLNLQGVEKSSWLHWGDTPIGWLTGQTLVVAPTAVGNFFPSAFTWTGAWGSRPSASLDVTLPDGSIAKPEVANLDRSITLKNLSRVHFHDGAGVQTLRWLSVADCGVTGVLAKYPIHFHLNGEASRGSLIEGVVSRNGKNHAFVPHGSHGITFRDCVAYNTTNDAYWWDPPLANDSTGNNSNDILYDHCLAMYVKPVPGNQGFRLSAFLLGAGANPIVRDSVAACVQGAADASGFHWPEYMNANPGPIVWTFPNNVAHNNKIDGIFGWQNDGQNHVIEDYIGYRNGLSQIDHGAYENRYAFKRCILMGGSEGSFKLHAKGNIVLEDFVADTPLRIVKHRLDAGPAVVKVRRCQFPSVIYTETSGGTMASNIRYEDCGLTPAKFSMAGAVQSSVAEIYEGGVLMHRWSGGSWQP